MIQNIYKLIFVLAFCIGSFTLQAQKSLRINVNNDYYSIQFKKVNQLSKKVVQYQLRSEAFGLATCGAEVKGNIDEITFGFYVDGKEVAMEKFLEIDPKKEGYIFSCGKVGDLNTQLGVFLLKPDDVKDIVSETTSEFIKQEDLFNKVVVVPSSTWEDINDYDKYFIDEVQVTSKKIRNDLKNEKVFVNKTWSLNQQDGDEWIEHYYYTSFEEYKKGMFGDSAPLEDIIEVVKKRNRNTDIVIEQKQVKEFSPTVKKKLKEQDGVRIIKKINGVQYLETYYKDGRVTRKPLKRVEKSTIKTAKTEQKEAIKEAQQIYPKRFKKLSKKREKLLWDKMYNRYSNVYIDGERFDGDDAKRYLKSKKKRIYKKFAEAAMHSKNGENNFYIFTNRRSFDLSGIKE